MTGSESGIPLLPARYDLRGIYGMHTDNKKENRKKNKSELGDIEVHAMHKGEVNHVDHIDKCINKQEDQSRQKFEFIPFHREEDSAECNDCLKDGIHHES